MNSRRAALQMLCAAGVSTLLPPAWAQAGKVKPDAQSALIVVDVQNCFVTGGTLAVKGGEQVVPVINRLAEVFANVIVTQDWHTPGHASLPAATPARSRSIRSS
jgi:nicotinamidase/pyrazinamidase